MVPPLDAAPAPDGPRDDPARRMWARPLRRNRQPRAGPLLLAMGVPRWWRRRRRGRMPGAPHVPGWRHGRRRGRGLPMRASGPAAPRLLALAATWVAVTHVSAAAADDPPSASPSPSATA